MCVCVGISYDAILASRFDWNNFGEQGWHALSVRLEHTRLDLVQFCQISAFCAILAPIRQALESQHPFSAFCVTLANIRLGME